MKKLIQLGTAALILAVSSTASAMESFEIIIKDHMFHPADTTIPANTKVKLVVKNQGKTAEEFESHSMHREKVIPAGKQANIIIGPLKPGTYKFVGEFHEDTAKGRIIVK